jgi:hypothetical protein
LAGGDFTGGAFGVTVFSPPFGGDSLAADFDGGVFDATGLTAAAFIGAGLPFALVGSGALALGNALLGAAFAGPGFAADLLRALPAFAGLALAAALAGCGRFALFFTSVFRTFQLHCRAHPAQRIAQFLHAFVREFHSPIR